VWKALLLQHPSMMILCGNPRCVEGLPPSTPIDDDSLRGVVASTKEDDISLVKFELSLYRCIHVDDNNVKSPLQWWKDHAK